jgi:secondary thiamine-phosphate synthase enzyme
LPNTKSFCEGDNGIVILYEEFEVKTCGCLEALDITEEVSSVVRSSGVSRGSVLVFSPHTTCSVAISAPGTETTDAMRQAMSTMAPSNGYYAHDDMAVRTENLVDDEPANAPAHIFHVFAGRASECIPIVEGSLALGNGQRILFVELDSARFRRYGIQVTGE